MNDDNPYRVSPGAQRAQPDQHEPRSSTRRSASEWIVYVSLALFPVFWGLLFAFGTFSLTGAIAGMLVLGTFLLFGLVTLTLMWRRHKAGAVASIVFYAIQIVSITFPGGFSINFNSLPTFNFTFSSDSGMAVSLNLVGLILCLLSVRVWREYVAAERLPQ